MNAKLLCDGYDALQQARNSNDLRLESEKFAHRMGFEHFAYALIVQCPSLRPQQYFINGFPLEWVQKYVSKGYFQHDPVVTHAQRNTLPAVWDDETFHGGKFDEFWEEARSFGLHSGLTFSVHDQPGVTGIFSLARDRLIDVQGVDLAALIGRAQMFASLLHQAVVRIDLPKLLPEQNVSLTAREQECLKWAADGKTNWEIGQILKITERTAVFHLNNVTQKLGASNKTQAIVRAVALKLL